MLWARPSHSVMRKGPRALHRILLTVQPPLGQLHDVTGLIYKYKSTWLLQSTCWITVSLLNQYCIVTDKRLLQLIDCRDLGMLPCIFFPFTTEKVTYQKYIYEFKVLDRWCSVWVLEVHTITALRYIQQRSDLLYLG